MNLRFGLAVVAGSVVMLITGAVLYAVIFKSLFNAGVIASPAVVKTPILPIWIIGGQIGFALLVALVIRWRGATTWRGGASTGAIFGFLMAIGYDFAQFGTTQLWTLTATLVDPFITSALVASGGAVIGAILESPDRELRPSN